jgi:hypothetical protein
MFPTKNICEAIVLLLSLKAILLSISYSLEPLYRTSVNLYKIVICYFLLLKCHFEAMSQCVALKKPSF